MTLANAPVNSIFVDNNTKFNGEPIEWVVASIGVEGQGITALMLKTPLSGYCFDAKEPQNPTPSIQTGGNGDYDTSNILQWLNSDGSAGHWYVAQHQYDYPPESETVAKGTSYASSVGFLNGFGALFKDKMISVTKHSISRKVHLPTFTEMFPNETLIGGVDFDSGATYTGFNNTRQFYHSYLIQSASPTYGYHSAIRMRGNNSESVSQSPVLYYGKTSSDSTSRYRGDTAYAYDVEDFINGTYPYYVVPVVYVENDIPVTYDSSTQKYYHNFTTETEYANYGSHKGGFSFSAKINTADSTTATVKAYVGATEIKSFSVSTFNSFVTLTFSDSDLEDLSSGSQTIRLVATQGDDEGETSFTYTKVAESVPTILTNTVGHVAEAFTTTYQVYEEDGDSIDVVVTLDSTQISSQTDVTQNTDIPIAISSVQFGALSYGNHSITISATDGTNTSTATISFTKNSVPTVSVSPSVIGEVISPFTVQVTANSADGDTITITAYIDGQEITV